MVLSSNDKNNFVCMGQAVSDSPQEKPDPSKYCCAKKDILIKGEDQLLDSSFKQEQKIQKLNPNDAATVSLLTFLRN